MITTKAVFKYYLILAISILFLLESFDHARTKEKLAWSEHFSDQRKILLDETINNTQDCIDLLIGDYDNMEIIPPKQSNSIKAYADQDDEWIIIEEKGLYEIGMQNAPHIEKDSQIRIYIEGADAEK